MIGFGPANTDLFVRPVELSFYVTIVTAAVGLDTKTAEGPQLPLGAEAVRGLYDANQHCRPDRTHRRNLTEQLPRRVSLAFAEQLAPHLLAQGTERIELLEVELRAA